MYVLQLGKSKHHEGRKPLMQHVTHKGARVKAKAKPKQEQAQCSKAVDIAESL